MPPGRGRSTPSARCAIPPSWFGTTHRDGNCRPIRWPSRPPTASTATSTTAGGKPLAGGLPFPTPVGEIYSSNITPDPQTGLGNYDLKSFIRVMRYGVKPDGTRLYPAMPYTSYDKVSDADLQDLFAYLRHDVAPVHQATKTGGMAWPLTMRWPLALWDLAFHKPTHYENDPSKSDQWTRGAYLVQGLAHCGTCHTPRGPALQEQDVAGKTTLYLSGTSLDGSSPINLRGNIGDGLGSWTVTDIAELLKTGVNAHSAVTGPMAGSSRPARRSPAPRW